MSVRELDIDDYIFLGEYLMHGNGAKAWRATGYTGKNASQMAYDLLRQPRIIKEIARCKAAAVKKVSLTVDDVVRDIKNVLDADARELAAIHMDACRYCHGLDFGYQFTPAEFKRAQVAHAVSEAAARGVPFDQRGGIGFNPNNDPHPDCPECHGRGILSQVATDTRNLSEASVTYYAGAKPTAHGVEILTRSKDQARKDAAQYLGMNKINLNIDDNRKAKDLTDDELSAHLVRDE